MIEDSNKRRVPDLSMLDDMSPHVRERMMRMMAWNREMRGEFPEDFHPEFHRDRDRDRSEEENNENEVAENNGDEDGAEEEQEQQQLQFNQQFNDDSPSYHLEDSNKENDSPPDPGTH